MKHLILMIMISSLVGCVGKKSNTQPQGVTPSDLPLVQTDTVTQNGTNSSISTETQTQTSTSTSTSITATSTTTESTISTQTVTSSSTNTQCDPQPAWSIGAWSPESCSPESAQQTRSVICNSTCPCPDPQPTTIQACIPNLNQGVHYDSQCTQEEGTVTWVDGKRICSFEKSACPSGWSALNNQTGIAFTITKATKAIAQIALNPGQSNNIDEYDDDDILPYFLQRVTTQYHPTFEPAKSIETLTYCSRMGESGCTQTKTIYAKIIKVACY